MELLVALKVPRGYWSDKLALMAFGKNWKQIEEVVQTRSTAQVRSHAQKFFLKLLKIMKERKKNAKKGIVDPSKADQ